MNLNPEILNLRIYAITRTSPRRLTSTYRSHAKIKTPVVSYVVQDQF